MNGYNINSLKEKISTRKECEIKQNAAARFKSADETLGIKDLEENKNALLSSYSKVVRKTFSIPSSDLALIEIIKDKALNKKRVLSDSEIVRLGFLILSELSDEDLNDLSQRIKKIPVGRPLKKDM